MTYFWIEMLAGLLAIVVAVGVMKTKKDGWGAQSISALSLAVGVPALIILGLEKVIDSQGIAALLGTALGFGAGKAAKD